MAVDLLGLMDLLKGGFSYTRVMAEAFDFEKTSVGWKADLPQPGQVTQPFTDGEVASIINGGFGAGPGEGLAGNLLVILLDLGALVVDVQRGRDPFSDHPGAKGARGRLGNATLKDELHLIGTPQVQVLADDLLKEEATGQGSVQDLGERELGLQDGQVVGVTRLPVGLGEGMG